MKKRPPPRLDYAAEIPLDSASWWPLTESLDERTVRLTQRGEMPVHFTPERERAEREWGERAGLRSEPLEHEREAT